MGGNSSWHIFFKRLFCYEKIAYWGTGRHWLYHCREYCKESPKDLDRLIKEFCILSKCFSLQLHFFTRLPTLVYQFWLPISSRVENCSCSSQIWWIQPTFPEGTPLISVECGKATYSLHQSALTVVYCLPRGLRKILYRVLYIYTHRPHPLCVP